MKRESSGDKVGKVIVALPKDGLTGFMRSFRWWRGIHEGIDVSRHLLDHEKAEGRLKETTGQCSVKFKLN